MTTSNDPPANIELAGLNFEFVEMATMPAFAEPSWVYRCKSEKAGKALATMRMDEYGAAVTVYGYDRGIVGGPLSAWLEYASRAEIGDSRFFPAFRHWLIMALAGRREWVGKGMAPVIRFAAVDVLSKDVVDGLRFFSCGHLPPKLRGISRPFLAVAEGIAWRQPGPETVIALRHLLDAKDAYVAVAAVNRVQEHDKSDRIRFNYAPPELFAYEHLSRPYQCAVKPFFELAGSAMPSGVGCMGHSGVHYSAFLERGATSLWLAKNAAVRAMVMHDGAKGPENFEPPATFHDSKTEVSNGE